MMQAAPFLQPARNSDKGAVLVMVLLVLSVLVVASMESMRLMQVEQVSSRIFASSLQGRSLSRAGISFARFLLIRDLAEQESAAMDHNGETWAGFLRQDEIPRPELQTGELNGTITDEQGKFPVNDLIGPDGNFRQNHKQVLERLLEAPPFSLDPMRRDKIVQSLKDWLDADGIPTGELGAESAYYQASDKDYRCKNGPMRTIGELLLVRGVDGGLYAGEGEGPGLKDLLTVHSNGKININTAPEEILAALVNPALSRETAIEFARAAIDYRSDSRHYDFLGEVDWYRNRVPGYNDVQFPADLLTTSSDHFSVLVTATSGSIGASRFCVLERSTENQKPKIEILLTEVR
jgi:general secretion pathway protein K